ncbi:peptide deformylase [Rhizobium halophilum]|uniref:peptide deformylase n=1 Tax=Rhizobium halophilum TaxID=2846852 RepID=UPI001EFE3F00|nr:peptide deformylase [Rhizobium halophilum]MCF6371161.1 peptide deformylase [Rhizobium halophilum]
MSTHRTYLAELRSHSPDILVHPHPSLRAISSPVTVFGDDLVTFASVMFEMMRKRGGVGLAANQVGIRKRVVVVDLSKHMRSEPPIVLVNPVIVKRSLKKATFTEGCLSLPGVMMEVSRPSKVTVIYSDVSGVETAIKAEGILAACLQHEIDHLDGVLISDYDEPRA